MKKSLLVLLMMFAPVLAAMAQDSDSLRRIDIENVVVTGTRSRTDVRHLPMTVSVVGRPRIESEMQPSLLPMLSEQVPGLFVTQRGVLGYGVSDGAAGGISLRGLGSGSGRLMVLVDGHPQYMGLFGHPIADVCNSYMTERVEVLRGPASTLYGSNAMGGVINIVTRKMTSEGSQTDIVAGYGSFNTLQTEAVNRFRRGGFTSVAGVTYDRTDGHRRGMGFEEYGGYLKTGYEISSHWSLRTEINATHFDASNPGAVTNPMAEVNQKVTRGTASASLENEYEHWSGGLSLFYNWGRHKINDGYAIATGTPRAYLFNSRDSMTGLSLWESVQLFRGNRLTAGFDWYSFGGSTWNRYFRDTRDAEGTLTHAAGDYTDITELGEYEIAGYIDFRQHIGSRLTLDAGVRLDHHSHVGTEWVPQAGLSLHLPRGVEMKLSASKGFRYPTLREMYMFPPQNPDLRPERLWNYELSLAQTLAGGRVSYGVNIFYIDGRDLIVTVRDNGLPLNVNQSRIENAGVEASAEWRISSAWAVDANYSWLHMKYPVLAAPEHKLHIGASFTRGRWAAATGIMYVAGLYTSTSPATTENFVLWNARVSFRATRWLALWVRGDNLLAQKYEINAGYPMPRATVQGGVKLSF